MTIDPATVDAVRTAWAEGAPVVLPTDTVYGLVVPAADEEGVTRIFSLKGRPIDRRMAVLVADLDQAAAWVEVTPAFRRLAERWWPGGLTIVAPRRPAAPTWVGDADTLGVRCPDDETLRALAAEVGPLAATSANRHGDPPAPTAPEVAEALPAVGLVVDGGPRHGAPSTVVVLGPNGHDVVREGTIPAVDIDAVLAAPS